jgi:hypothetical protein
VAVVALVGLFLLAGSTVPAVLRRERLARDHARLREEIARQETLLRALDRELQAARTDAFAQALALHDLLQPPPPPADPRGP